MNPTLLIVDDEKTQREGLRSALEDHFDVYLAEDAKTAIELLEKDHFDVLLTDFRLPSEDGMKLITRAKSLSKPPICILMTAYGSEELAVEAMKRGADDYIAKGRLQIDELEMRIARALKHQTLETENVYLHQQLDSKFRTENVIGRSEPMRKVLEDIQQVAPTAATVLLQGESGTGKELIAKVIHQLSPRARQPLVTVHCAALTPTLLESELFGHERGAFTGAVAQHVGRFEQADRGTLFLDEIGDLDIDLQAKLLRVVQTGCFERVGGNQTVRSNVRIVSATNRDLAAMIADERFREDLWYRLNVVTIELPTLAERRDDIPLIADHLVTRLAKKYEWPGLALSPEASDWLAQQPWPGNVRELQNVLARAAALARGRLILRADLTPAAAPRSLVKPAIHEGGGLRLKDILAETEQRVIAQALEHASWNRTQAARQLGISRRQLFDKIRLYNLRPGS